MKKYALLASMLLLSNGVHAEETAAETATPEETVTNVDRIKALANESSMHMAKVVGGVLLVVGGGCVASSGIFGKVMAKESFEITNPFYNMPKKWVATISTIGASATLVGYRMITKGFNGFRAMLYSQETDLDGNEPVKKSVSESDESLAAN